MLKTIRSRSLPEQPQVRSTKLIMLMDITRKLDRTVCSGDGE
ncbi:hypothetical protein V6Z12_D10G233800 [Gossypium hirsutum]